MRKQPASVSSRADRVLRIRIPAALSIARNSLGILPLNRSYISEDLCAEGHALIADKDALRRCGIPTSAFNEVSDFMLRFATKRTGDVVMLDGTGHRIPPLLIWMRRRRVVCADDS